MEPGPSKVGHDVLGRTIRESNQDNLAEWMQTATPDGKLKTVSYICLYDNREKDNSQNA